MKRKLFQKVLCLLLSVTTLLGALGISVSAKGLKGDDVYSSLEDMLALVDTNSYEEYLKSYEDIAKPGSGEIKIDITKVSGNGAVVAGDSLCYGEYQEDKTNWENFGDNWQNSVYLSSSSSATWSFNVSPEAEGFYYIKIEYYTCNTEESSVSSIERKLYLDSAIPFSEASALKLSKQWRYDNAVVETTDAAAGDEEGTLTEYYRDSEGSYKKVTTVKGGKKTVTTYTITQDINGNSMAPTAVQDPNWNTYYCQDSTGYYDGYFSFYLLNGDHQLTLESIREPMIVKSITLVPSNDTNTVIPSYADVLKEYESKGYQPANGSVSMNTVIEAEFPDYVSDSSVASTNDNTSAINSPAVSGAQLYNVIGENSYDTVGQWAAYNFTVNSTGLYKLAMRFKQDALQGMFICRTIKLAGGQYGLEDGTPTVPFKEAYNTQFNYSKDWQSSYVGDGTNEFWFYFEEGVEYTLYLECSLGSLRDLIKAVEDSLNIINNDYLSILQLTGSDADADRNYNFIGLMPEVLVSLLEQAIALEETKNGLEELCGTSGSHTATLYTVAVLLDTMGSDRGDNIAANMANLKSYLGTLGTWINNSKKSSMMVDHITVCPANAGEKDLPRANANFFQSIWFEISSFFSSFFTDYNAMGLTSIPDENTTTVSVWLASGRDQSNIWRTMVDAKGGYTDKTGTAVALKLITGGTLLPSILADKGPDVYMGLGASDVINYAIREAVVGMSGNDRRLSDEDNAVFTTVWYTYLNEDGTYERSTTYDPTKTLMNVSNKYQDVIAQNFSPAALKTLTLLEVSYGVPNTMSFPMMFYRMDVLADLGLEVPETWDELLAMLPSLQANNMQIGISYIDALDFMLYQMGGSMWKYEDNPAYAGAQIGLDTDVAYESFEFCCRLYSAYSFPISYDASNRFRTGEMPIVVGGYTGVYNTLVVYATEIAGLWEFSSLPGVIDRETGELNYKSLAGVSATVMLYGCDNFLDAWQFVQWQTSAEVQANYGNKMVALIGPSAKYETANLNAIKNLSWTASEYAAIMDQIQNDNLDAIVNYPGSYIYGRYIKFAFLDVQNNGADPVDALSGYIDAINAEITRKREEFKNNGFDEIEILAPGQTPPEDDNSAE
ncbi:MAG: extracellular solute-binding protein [Clostridia bacterium]|nr:extracellular solute-binding protein [Clostridia bacterium]